MADDYDEQTLQAMVAENQRKSAAANAEVLEGLWTAFDRDRNGSLDRAECTALMREYLQAAAKYLPQIATESMQLGLEASLANVDPAMRAELEKEINKMVKTMKVQVKETLDNMIDELRANLDANAAQLLVSMDVDGNGRVEKAEFLDRFLGACNSFVSADALSSSLARASSA